MHQASIPGTLAYDAVARHFCPSGVVCTWIDLWGDVPIFSVVDVCLFVLIVVFFVVLTVFSLEGARVICVTGSGVRLVPADALV